MRTLPLKYITDVDYIVGHYFAGDGTNGYDAQIEQVAEQLEIEAWAGNVVVSRTADSSINGQSTAYSLSENTVKAVTHSPDEE